MSSTAHLPLGLHFGITEETYRADFGFNQSLLKAFGNARSPAHFKWEQANPREETDSLRIGSWVDAAIFCDKKLPEFAVWKGERRGNAWTDFKSAQVGKTILNGAEHDRAYGAYSNVVKNEDFRRILAVCNCQVAAITEHPSLKFRMKGLVDLLPDPSRCDPLLLDYAFDLKTASDASPEGFAKACYEFGYDVQAAFYSDILNLLGMNVKTFGFIVVENRPPHLVKIHFLTLDSQIIKRARQRYEDWMLEYNTCLTTDSWPGYTSGWSEIQYKPWMLRDEGYAGEELQ